jgi:hypothetical protein
LKKIFFVLLILNHLLLLSQVKLNGSIVSGKKPKDKEAIRPFISSAKIPETRVLSIGDKIPQFKLYGIKNDSLDISAELSKGKPVCLISGSYACPIYRGAIPHIDSLKSFFNNEISFFTIYVPEAHPKSPDLSPYTGEIWEAKYREISFDQKQAKTYLERRKAAQRLVTEGFAPFPVFIDNPDNSWWTIFALAPSIVLVILPNGTIYSKYDLTKSSDNNKGKAEILIKLIKDLHYVNINP